MDGSRIISKRIEGTAQAHTGRARLGAIYAVGTTAGRLKLYDGTTASDPLVLDIDIPVGFAQIEPDGVWAFNTGIYAVFATLVGGVTLNLY